MLCGGFQVWQGILFVLYSPVIRFAVRKTGRIFIRQLLQLGTSEEELTTNPE